MTAFAELDAQNRGLLAVIGEWSISKRFESVQGTGKSREGSPAFL